MGEKMDTEVRIPEETVDCDGTNFYAMLTKAECERLDQILKENKAMFRVQKNATSSLIKLIIENTYLYINNNEIDIDGDISKILTKKYYRNLDDNFKKTITQDQRTRDFIVELVRVRLLKQYASVPVEDENDELIKKQFRLSNDDTKIMSILMGSKALTSPDYISSLIRYFLYSNTREILNYKSICIVDNAIKNKEYIMLGDSKVKPIAYIFDRYYKCLFYINETKKTVNINRYGFFNGLEVVATNLKYSLSYIEEQIVNLRKQLKNVSISYDLVDGIDLESTRAYYLLDDGFNPSDQISKTTDGNHVEAKYKYSRHLSFNFEKYAKEGYIKNLQFSENYAEYRKVVDEYMGIRK